jgi:adenylyltransferase/sulfurtransferase
MRQEGGTVRIRLPAVLRGLAGGRPDARGEGRTVGEVLRSLEREHPGLRERLVDARGRPRRYLSLFLNEEDVRHLAGLDTPVRDGDELTVVPAIAGGAPLTDEERARHAGQTLVPGLGEGQERLAGARVRVVGAGKAIGPALLALAQAGVGRIWIDDPEDVSAADEGGWVFPPGAAGMPRADTAVAALTARSRFVGVERYPTGGVPTATLVCAPTVAEALIAAEQARRAGVPHVVLEVDGDGGAVVTVPPGAPCYACARSTTSGGRPAEAGAAVVACLAAAELVLAVASPENAAGRRIELLRGLPASRPTVRLAGCACARGTSP